MIDAFKSTLDELAYASLALLVLDINESADEIRRKFESSRDVINEFEVPDTKIIYVLNKVDLTTIEDAFHKADQLGILDSKRLLAVSAKTGYNIDQLKNLITSRLFETKKVRGKQEISI
jgi:GTP-binding protein HflX